MSFEVDADAYGRFMGRYAGRLAPAFADLTGVSAGQRAADVGCGPGALTAELVARLGEGQVRAIDPSPPFVAACRARFPGVDVQQGVAEALPWADDEVDVAMAQLVVQFMTDPAAGLAEMARVTAPGGVVAACVWDHAGGRGPLSGFWRGASRAVSARGEGSLPGTAQGDLARLLDEAGLARVEDTVLEVVVGYASFEEWWEPYTLGVGPAGDLVASLSADDREAVREQCRAELGDGPFEVSALAWAAVGRVR